MTRNDIVYFMIWMPWEIVILGIGAIIGWPTKEYFDWLLLGIIAGWIWSWRKEWML